MNLFGRTNENGKISILNAEDGSPVTRLNGTKLYNNDLNASYEHPAGLVAESESEAREAVEASGNTWGGLE